MKLMNSPIKISSRPLVNAEQTARYMYYLSRKYYLDMVAYSDYTIIEVFELISSLPYEFDPPGHELVKRPLYTIQGLYSGGDCDDKSVCVGAWCELTNTPYRFIGVGNPKPGVKYGIFDKIKLQHVFCLVNIMGRWVIFDPTYSFNTLGRIRGNYKRKVIFKP